MQLSDDEEIVRVATGHLVQVELWQQVLAEAGVPSRVVGDELNTSLNGMVPGAELWVPRRESDRATALLNEAEADHHAKPAEEEANAEEEGTEGQGEPEG
jgi:hypothetical protein